VTAPVFHCLSWALPLAAFLILVGLVIVEVLDRRDDRRRDREVERLNTLFYGDSAVAPEPRRQP
jgi:hypothetical protein